MLRAAFLSVHYYFTGIICLFQFSRSLCTASCNIDAVNRFYPRSCLQAEAELEHLSMKQKAQVLSYRADKEHPASSGGSAGSGASR